MFTLGTISCRDQTSDMQTSLWEAFQHFTLLLTPQGHTATELSLTYYNFIVSGDFFLQISVGGFKMNHNVCTKTSHKTDGI